MLALFSDLEKLPIMLGTIQLRSCCLLLSNQTP